MPEIIADNIDRLVTVEMRVRGLPRGKTRALYDAARRDAGRPLVLQAAEGLIERVKPGSRVLITCATGGPPYLPFGESDGPPGGAAIANTLSLALGAVPLFVVSDAHREPVVRAATAIGLPVLEPELALARSGAAGVVPFPQARAEGPDTAARLLDQFAPDAVVSIETLAPNAAGVVHSVMGVDVGAGIPAYDELVKRARARGIYTVGVGDGGNEIGFGRIVDDVRQIQDYGASCQCPCGQGMATVVATDALVVAAVSNWGAYGLAAMLAFVREQPTALHDPDDERRVLEACAAAGAADGAHSRTTFSVDGIAGEVSVAVVRMLGEIIRNGLIEIQRPY
jgi:hypothetical protein